MTRSLKQTFHTLVLLLIIVSLYPGSIFGYIFYGDINKQPHILSDVSSISLSHFCTYLFISFLGFYSYSLDKRFKFIFLYLLLLSLLLELLHLVIPQRAFEISDLIGNILGVLSAFMLILFFKFLKKQ